MERFDILKLGLILLALLLMINLLVRQYSTSNDIKSEGFKQKEKFLLKKGNDVYDTFYAPIYQVIMEDPKKINYELNEIASISNIDKHSVVLDVGCGVGGHLIHLKHSIPKCKCVGLDQSKAMIKYAQREEYKYLKKRDIEWVHGDILDNYQFEPETFTHIFALQFSLYCIENKSRFFENCYDFLQKDGSLIIHLVNKYKFDPIVNPANPLWMISPQKYYKERMTKSHVKFDDMTYKSSFDMKDNNTCEFNETMIDERSQHIRKNKHILYMMPQKQILNLASECGFSILGKVDLKHCGYEYQYIYILRK